MIWDMISRIRCGASTQMSLRQEDFAFGELSMQDIGGAAILNRVGNDDGADRSNRKVPLAGRHLRGDICGEVNDDNVDSV